MAARSVSLGIAAASLCTLGLCQCPTNLIPWVVDGTTATGWPSSGTITVYVVSNGSTGYFSSTEQSNISTAFTNWNSTLGSGIDFSEDLVTSMPLVSGNYVEVVYGTPDCGEGAVACTELDVFSNGQTDWAETVVATSGIDADEFLPLMAHEAGHTYGADDCADCSSSVTIMSDDSLNSGDPTSPLCCDQMLLWDMTGGVYGTQSCGYGGDCGNNSWCVGGVDTSLNCVGDYYYCYSGCCFSDGGGGECNEDGYGCETDGDCCNSD